MPTSSPVNTVVRARTTTWVPVLMVMALAFAGILLLSDLPFVPAQLHPYLSSLPLAIAGIVYAIFQIRVRPALGVLLKRLLLAATFVIWAADQLLPPGRFATVVGDVVFAAYVLDLYWLVQEQVAAVNAASYPGDPST